MLFKIVDPIRFLIKSTNEHGVHSPFVFDYLTKCLYKVPRAEKDKTLDVLYKSIPYFNVKQLSLAAPGILEKQVLREHPNVQLRDKPYDLCYIDTPDLVLIEKRTSQEYVHNDSIMVLKGIHQSRSTLTLWRSLISKKEVTVSIDFYHCGVVFFRREQAKEHFTIRI